MTQWTKRLILIPFVLFLFLFLFIPLITMVLGSFQADGTSAFGLMNYKEILTKTFYTQAFINSVIIALISAGIGLIGAFILSFCLLQLSEKTQTKMNSFLNIAANFAGVPLAFAFILLLGNSGLLTLLFKGILHFDLYSWLGLAMTFIYFQIPLGVIFIYPVLRSVHKEWKEAATLLGATHFIYGKRVLFPILSPCILGTFILLFANGMGTYETAYALTGSNFNLLTIRISALSAGDIYSRPNLASALACLFAFLMVLTMLFAQKLMKQSKQYQ